MFCARCGATIPERGVFCPACGKPFAVPTQATPGSVPSAAAASVAPAAPPKKRRALRVAGAILALLILCCCCGPLAMSATGQTIDLGEIQLSDSVLRAIGVDKMIESALDSFFLFSDDDEGSGDEDGSRSP